VSELLKRHTAIVLREQWAAERYWPAGQAAEAYRAILTGKIIGQRISHDDQAQKDIEMIVKMLDGTFDPEKDIPKGRGLPGPEEMKRYLT